MPNYSSFSFFFTSYGLAMTKENSDCSSKLIGTDPAYIFFLIKDSIDLTWKYIT